MNIQILLQASIFSHSKYFFKKKIMYEMKYYETTIIIYPLLIHKLGDKVMISYKPQGSCPIK